MTAKQSYSRVGWSYFALMGITQLLGNGFSLLLAVLWPTALVDHPWLVWAVSYVPLYGIAVPVFFWMMHRLVPTGPAPAAGEGMGPARWLRLFVLLMGSVYVLNIVSLGINYLLTGRIVNTLNDMTQAGGYVSSVLVGCIIAPVGEEFLFRWALWNKVGRYGEKAYILLGGVIFALFHGNLSQLLYAFFCGAVLCYVYAKTGRLAYTISLHVAINVMGIAVGPLAALGQWGGTALVVFMLAMIVGAGCVLALYGRRPRYAPAQDPAAPAHPVRTALAAPGMLAYTLLCLALVVLMVLVSMGIFG